MRNTLKKLILTLTIVCICIVLGIYLWGNPTNMPWQDTVDAFSSLVHAQVHIPEHLLQVDAVRTGDEFDPNEYFSVLTHLSMQQGHILDYVYHYDIMGGEPILYARPVDKALYSTYSDYRGTIGEESFLNLMHTYLNHVQVDDTEQGFFEFIVLRIMGGQFYLAWHGGYNDTVIICDREALEVVLSSGQGFGNKLPLIVQMKARFLKLEPVVRVREDTVLVRLVTFTKWGGFMRESYTISRDFPHRVLEEKRETLIEYDCGWAF